MKITADNNGLSTRYRFVSGKMNKIVEYKRVVRMYYGGFIAVYDIFLKISSPPDL